MLFDPADPAFGARSPAIYRDLRDNHPCYADPEGRFYALSRFEDVRVATLDWETFTSTGKAERLVIKPSMNSYDPPRHTELRAIISRAFTPKRISQLEPEIRTIARSLIDELASAEGGDAITQYARILPSIVIGRLIGLPDELIPVTRALTDRNMRKVTIDGHYDAAQQAYTIFAELYDQRRAEPKDDLLTALIDAEIDGQRLTDDDLAAFGWLLIVGGNDTTTNLIGNGLELLARYPDARRQLAADSSLLPDAIEEIFRIASPTHSLPRTAARDIEMYGTLMPGGARVLLVWSAANLDEREFDDPERFDIRRRATRHLALGHGLHYCLGAALARLEARIAFEEFLNRIPDYAIDGPVQRLVSNTFYGFESLPISFPAT